MAVQSALRPILILARKTKPEKTLTLLLFTAFTALQLHKHMLGNKHSAKFSASPGRFLSLDLSNAPHAAMNLIPDVLYANENRTTWLIVGASRGIGLEFVRQLLKREERILATVRDPNAWHASGLWSQVGSDHGRCQMFFCDVLSEASITVHPITPTRRCIVGLTRLEFRCRDRRNPWSQTGLCCYQRVRSLPV